MKKYFISLGLLLIIFGSAMAGNTMYFPNSYAKAGPYLGIDAGWSFLSIYAGQDDEIDQHGRIGYYGSIPFNAYVGYNFQLNDYLLLGVELGGQFLGSRNWEDASSTEYSEESLSQQAIDLLFTSRIYVYKGWNFFGKLGVAAIYQISKNIIFKDNHSWDIFRFRPEYVIGMGYTFSKQIDLHLMYQHTGSESDDDDIAASSAVMLGLGYTF
jgi:opacity protein-like surface antigen